MAQTQKTTMSVEERIVSLLSQLTLREKVSFSFYNPYLKRWVAEPGQFEILIGASSRDIRQKCGFVLK